MRSVKYLVDVYIFFFKYKTPAEFVERCRIKGSLFIKIHFYDCELIIKKKKKKKQCWVQTDCFVVE